MKNNKDYGIFLNHILESIEAIEKYTKGYNKKKFKKDYEKQDSVLRRFEIIGEAVKNLPVDLKRKYPHIPWQDVAGMRDILIHHYFGVNLDIVWSTIKNLLPDFKKEIVEILNNN